MTDYTSGFITCASGGNEGTTTNPSFNTVGVHTVDVDATPPTANGNIVFTSPTQITGSITDISVKEVLNVA